MPQAGQAAKLLRIHICERDRYGDRPLYEALIYRCKELGLRGATAFKGLEGYGERAEIHRRHLIAHDQPVVVIVVDTEENIVRALPVLEEMIGSGMIAASNVEMKRLEHPPVPKARSER